MNDENGKHYAIELARELWRHFNLRQWDSARRLLADDFDAHWPQYPGKGSIEVVRINHSYNEEEQFHEVTTVVKIDWEKPDGSQEELYGVSFFEIDEKLVRAATEYWAESYPAPAWRKKYVGLENATGD